MQRKIAVFTALLVATLALMLAGHGDGPAIAGTSTPNVAGKWEGSWSHRMGSGQITLQLAQEGTKVSGKQSVAGVMPAFGAEQRQVNIGQEIRDGTLEGSTLIFNVAAPDTPTGQLNFTLTVSGQNMTGTACGNTCATLKLKKSKM